MPQNPEYRVTPTSRISTSAYHSHRIDDNTTARPKQTHISLKTKHSSIMGGKSLVTSHGVFFVAGFALGKYVDHEELMNYRDAHEGFGSRWRRRAGNAALGVAVLGAMTVVLKVTSRSSGSPAPATL
ncbi:unnamed protein product [Cylindrotheca closterium]|uniref:Uncharacterized protein n=1 Tax=Cylindrotheca closterium TaxID=2856 RepID=A0AAD2G498_9STRA|nr:unnamed protein product [Cylindrotheca closterium]